MSSYLEKLRRKKPQVEANKNLRYVPFLEGLAQGIANCYYLVWGDGFPAKFMYDPDAIKDYYLNKGQVGGFAVTDQNEVVGMFCAYQFHFNPTLYELGGLMVIPSYRRRVDIERLIRLCQDQLNTLPIDAVFCQVVSHYQTPLKVLKKYLPEQIETGIEIDVFNYESDEGKQTTSYVDTVHVLSQKSKNLYAYEAYLTMVGETYERLTVAISIHSEIKEPAIEKSSTSVFSYEKVLKIQIKSIGLDFISKVKELTASDSFDVLQISISLEDNSAPWAIELLNSLGYFYSTIIPYYDGNHCLILQKLKNGAPSFTNIDLHTNQANRILEFIKNDHQRVSGLKYNTR
jgi:hypothetical protein